jgi:hypothetical protein
MSSRDDDNVYRNGMEALAEQAAIASRAEEEMETDTSNSRDSSNDSTDKDCSDKSNEDSSNDSTDEDCSDDDDDDDMLKKVDDEEIEVKELDRVMKYLIEGSSAKKFGTVVRTSTTTGNDDDGPVDKDNVQVLWDDSSIEHPTKSELQQYASIYKMESPRDTWKSSTGPLLAAYYHNKQDGGVHRWSCSNMEKMWPGLDNRYGRLSLDWYAGLIVMTEDEVFFKIIDTELIPLKCLHQGKEMGQRMTSHMS